MRKVQISAFLSVLPGADCGDGVPDGEIVCTSAYSEGCSLDRALGEAAQSLRDAVRDAREGSAPATPCDGPRPRMCPMGMSMMRGRAATEPVNDLVNMFMLRALEKFSKIEVDWYEVSKLDAGALGVPSWLMDGLGIEFSKSLDDATVFADALDAFIIQRLDLFFILRPSRARALRLLFLAECASMFDALPILPAERGADLLATNWCAFHTCPCCLCEDGEDHEDDDFICPRHHYV